MSDNTYKAPRTGGNSRRRVLKTALLGGASVTAFKLAPESWTRPVVEAVSLPAHAQTSLTLPEGPWAGGEIAFGPGPARNRGLGDRLLNAILPEARAGGSEENGSECEAVFGICIDKIDDSTIRVRIGFNNQELGDRNVGVSQNGGALTFTSDQFGGGELTVNGELSADGETWTGRVEGLCLLQSVMYRQPGSLGPLGRIRTALADAVVPTARAGLDQEGPQVDRFWEAFINEPCELEPDPS